MKHFILKRRYFEHGTYSTMHRADSSKVCRMVEREWRNNEPFKSCVPEGSYLIVPHNSPKYGDCYALVAATLGVTIDGPSLRTACLIHPANKPSELLGCLSPGLDFGFLDDEWCVTHSGDAFDVLMNELGGLPAQLTIIKD
ncbi:DUF5675 family protein [Psychromonas ossibalaenae]|uniref:DUF5675 family protein n=1 Tax=Psychromonas ossibalaenae TaxID=444922 RepID=UPI0003700124|nr:DUF5675 family protein [Psychromonas ossibalaenae]